MTETLDERGDRLLRVAMDLSIRVRDDDPAAVKRHVQSIPRDELVDLAIILGALVPEDRTARDLLSWWLEPAVAPARRRLRPCGTRAAHRRHQLHGERPCPSCRRAETEYRRERRLRARAA